MIPLEEAHSAQRYGGKAAGLAALLARGLPVPPGYALSPEDLEQLAAGEGAAEAWRRAVSLGEAVAVRSSALAEDGSAHSFAGQHLTVLGVSSQAALVEAAARVRASAAASAAYRAKRGLAESPMAAVVQRLIDPVSSGVLFTCDPIDGRDEIVVEGSYGLGEAVVHGLVTPDVVRIARTGAVLERRLGEKDLEVVRVGAKLEERPVEAARQAVFCLSDPLIEALLSCVAPCEAAAGGPADVEWAWEAGHLWILQCRPVTTRRA